MVNAGSLMKFQAAWTCERVFGGMAATAFRAAWRPRSVVRLIVSFITGLRVSPRDIWEKPPSRHLPDGGLLKFTESADDERFGIAARKAARDRPVKRPFVVPLRHQFAI